MWRKIKPDKGYRKLWVGGRRGCASIYSVVKEGFSDKVVLSRDLKEIREQIMQKAGRTLLKASARALRQAQASQVFFFLPFPASTDSLHSSVYGLFLYP